MQHKYAAFIRFINVCFDFSVLNLALLLVIFSQGTYNRLDIHLINDQKVLILWINLQWIIASFAGRVYEYRNLVYFKDGIRRSASGFLFFIFFEVSLDVIFFGNTFFERNELLRFLVLFGVFYWTARLIFYALKKIYALELFSGKRVLLVGNDQHTQIIRQVFKAKKELGFIFSGWMPEEEFLNNYDGARNDLFERIEKLNVDEVFFIKSSIPSNRLYELVHDLDKETLRVRIVPDFFNFYTKPQNLSFIGDIPILSLRQEPLESLFNRMLKRGFDIVFSIFVIICVFSWVFPILAILIKLTSQGPVFFRQQRSGRDNKPFWCYKFRSMKRNSQSDSLPASKSDNRITWIGSIMRKTSMDEMPQFFNVLIGNMSIVGPRPHMLIQTKDYSNIVDKYMIRHFVKPGITGWAQVNGYRGEITKLEDLEKRVEYDIWYLENWSLLLDIQVILLTVYYVIKGQEKAY